MHKNLVYLITVARRSSPFTVRLLSSEVVNAENKTKRKYKMNGIVAYRCLSYE